MTPLNQINILICGICLTVGLIHLLVFYRRPDRKVDLFFGLMSLCIAGSAYVEIMMYTAIDVLGEKESLQKLQIESLQQ
jgi:hypothetical protein